MTRGPLVAVVGSGAWGTMRAILVARQEPAVLLARSPETVTRLEADRANERRLPGIALPPGVAVSAEGGPPGAVRGRERQALPGRSPRSRVEGRARRLPGLVRPPSSAPDPLRPVQGQLRILAEALSGPQLDRIERRERHRQFTLAVGDDDRAIESDMEQ